MKRTFCFVICICLLICAIPAFAEEQYGYCNANAVLRADASDKALSTGNVSKGTKVLIQDEIKDEEEDFTWYAITAEDGDKTGFVHSNDVDMVIAKKSMAKNQDTTKKSGIIIVQNEDDYPVLKASGIIPHTERIGTTSADQYTKLGQGDSGDASKAVKERLRELGYYDGARNTRFTKDVTQAITVFQKANELEEDGECTPELQALLFSNAARNKHGMYFDSLCPLRFSKGTVKASKSGGGVITLSLKNVGSDKIDAFNYSLKFYNTYGERFTLHSLSNEVTITDELTAFESSEERGSVKKNQTVRLTLDMGRVYFAGFAIAITGYHTTSGTTVRYNDDELVWYAAGKGVEEGYVRPVVTPLTAQEIELAKQLDFGVTGYYIDEEIAKEFGTMAGLLIETMKPNSIMDKAGLKAGDVILAIDNTRIFGGATIQRAEANAIPKESINILFWRNGAINLTTVVLQERESL